MVEKAKAIDGTHIRAGDVLLGLASSGPHSNGFSLIRRILEVARADLGQTYPGAPAGRTLLEPTRIYAKPVLALLRRTAVKGMAHITGGGLLENTHRMFPDDCAAHLERARWPRPAIFDWLQRAGSVAEAEMHRVFNCGIRMIVVVGAADAEEAMATLAAEGERVFRIGTVVPRAPGAPATVVA